jgi:hypothetical protein
MKKRIALFAICFAAGCATLWFMLDGMVEPEPAAVAAMGQAGSTVEAVSLTPFEAPGGVTSIWITGDPEITSVVTLTVPEKVAELLKLMDGAPPTGITGTESYLRFRVNTADSIYYYDVFYHLSGPPHVLLRDGYDWYTLPSNGIDKFIDSLNGLYLYEEHPQAFLALDEPQLIPDNTVPSKFGYHYSISGNRSHSDMSP